MNSEQHYDIDDACNKTFTSYGQTRSPSILMFGHQTTILYQAYVYADACNRVCLRSRCRATAEPAPTESGVCAEHMPRGENFSAHPRRKQAPRKVKNGKSSLT